MGEQISVDRAHRRKFEPLMDCGEVVRQWRRNYNRHAAFAKDINDPPNSTGRSFQEGAVKMLRSMLQSEPRKRSAQAAIHQRRAQPLNQSMHRTPSDPGETERAAVSKAENPRCPNKRRNQSNASPTAALTRFVADQSG